VTPGVFSIRASGGLLDPRRRSHPNGGWKLGFFTNTWVWLGSGAMLLAQLGVVGRRLWRGGLVFVLAEARKSSSASPEQSSRAPRSDSIDGSASHCG
jgi:hypothetical protein